VAITFDPSAKRIVLDTASVTAAELWSRWSDWAAASDNSKYLPAFRQVGGDDLGAGLSIPPYFFLQNGWRVRPMEANHALIITGNLFVEGGGVPVVNTLGAFNVSAQFTVPVQAQGISTGGSGGGLTTDQADRLARIEKFLRNKQITDPAAGTMTVFDDDGLTVLAQGGLFEDAAGSQAYRGQGAERRERLS
jgi:hypothetical protein